MKQLFRSGHRPTARRILVAIAFCTSTAAAQQQPFQFDVDLSSGTATNLMLEVGNPTTLQLATYEFPYRYMNVATLNGAGQDSGTIVRIDTESGEVLGEYRSAPAGYPTSPSRTSFDSQGNVWIGNRDIERIEEFGSIIKLGFVIGGTRCDANGIDDPQGGYLRPPFIQSTAIDRDGDGLIRTSRGLGDVLDWNSITDGVGGIGGTAALVEDALDECILVYQKVETPLVRHISVDEEDNVWVGDTLTNTGAFWKLDSSTGAILRTVDNLGCVGIGGFVDVSGIVWSASDESDQLMRFDPQDPLGVQCISIPSTHGLGLDIFGNVWNSQHNARTISKVASDGSIVFRDKTVPGSGVLRGVASTQDGHVWVADSKEDAVFRLDQDGNRIGEPIPVGDKPTNLSTDDRDQVWVVCKDSDEVQRIDPNWGANGQVNFNVPLTSGSAPQGYGDMTSTVVVDRAIDRGYWMVIQDSGFEGATWTSADWQAEYPAGSSIRAFARAADSEEELANSEPFGILNGVPFDAQGRFIEVQLRFIASAAAHQSPVVSELTLGGSTVGLGCATPNRRQAGSLLLYPYYRNAPGVYTLLTLTNTGAQDVDVEYVYINGSDCLEFNRTERLTANDTLTLVTSAHNPGSFEAGYVYAFAKQANQPVVSNGLIGQEVILNGFSESSQSFDYSINAVAFLGIGENGMTDLDGDGVRDLDGQEYSMAPDSILVPRFFGQRGMAESNSPEARLLLVALTGGPAFSTTLDLLIYNDNERVFSAEYTFECWAFPRLTELSNAFLQDFLSDATDHDPEEVLGAESIETGWFRVDGANASSTATSIPDPAFYGVLVDFAGVSASADLPFELCEQDNGGLIDSGLHGD